MNKKQLTQNIIIIVLGICIIVMSVGYAAYESNLEISGTSTIQKANWDVRLANAKTNTSTTTVDSSNIVTEPTLNDDGTVVTFAVKMNVGDTYEFTVDVLNAGTFDAKLSSYSLTGKKDDQAITIDEGAVTYSNEYLTYTISNLTSNEVLASGSSSTKTITIKAVEPTDPTTLPTTDTVYEFKLNMTYVQN